MAGADNEGADDDVASNADDPANDADDAADDAADEDVVVCLAPGSIADLDDDCWYSLGGARERYATAQNTLHVVHALLLHHSITLPLPKTLGSPVVQPQSPVGAAILFAKAERANGQAHLCQRRSSKIGRGVESLIARLAQVTQDRVLRSAPLVMEC
jgi:hypothetical protein